MLTSNVTTIVLILGWSAYSYATFGALLLMYLLSWGLVEVFTRWSGMEKSPIKSMYIGVGRNLGFLLPIIVYIVTIVAEAGISPFEGLGVTAFLLAFFYPVLMLISWVAILLKISPVLYAERYTKPEPDNRRWVEALRSSQPWGDLAVLTMVIGSFRHHRKVIVLLGLSLASMISVVATVPYLASIGWLPIVLQCGLGDALLIAYVMSYVTLDRQSLLQFMRL
jgi:hypothetical protein